MRLCAVCALFSRAYVSIVVVVSCFCEVVFDCLGICLLSLSCLLFLRSCVRLLGYLSIVVKLSLVFAKLCSIAWDFEH